MTRFNNLRDILYHKKPADKFDAQADESLIYSARTDTEKIKITLKKINALTWAYIDFAIVQDEIFSSKIYEIRN